LGGWKFEASSGKMFVRHHLNQEKLGVAAHICHPDALKKKKKTTITDQTGLGINQRPYLKNYQREKKDRK
jgi:hypothetical protein